MTLEELKINISRLKLPYLECNLFSPEAVPGRFLNDGLYVYRNGETWEIYHCDGPLKMWKASFYDEKDLYEFVFCYYKKFSDSFRIF